MPRVFHHFLAGEIMTIDIVTSLGTYRCLLVAISASARHLKAVNRRSVRASNMPHSLCVKLTAHHAQIDVNPTAGQISTAASVTDAVC